MARTRLVGLTGSAVQLAMAGLLGGIASQADVLRLPPEPIPRGLALGLLYALPAVIGAIGATSGRRPLLAAASIMSVVGSVLAFSGVTLMFLVPAIVFAAAAGAGHQATTPLRPSWRLVLSLVVVAVAATIAVLQIGIFAVPVLVLLVLALEVGRGSHRAPDRVRVTGVLMAVVIAALGIGSGWALLSITETHCWKAYDTPHGLEYRTVADPGDDSMEFSGNAVGGGCNSGVLTPTGAAAASGLALASVAVATTVAVCGTRRSAEVQPESRSDVVPPRSEVSGH
jgi:hypothetical protein